MSYSNGIYTLGDNTNEADENTGYRENNESLNPGRKSSKEDVNGNSKGIDKFTPTVGDTTTRADLPTHKSRTTTALTVPGGM